MNARTAAGATLRLGDALARGGEAVIHTVVGDGGLLAKVFMGDRSGMEDKLRAMRDHPPPDPAGVPGHSAIAWPRELLYDERRRLIGFLMPYVREAVPALDVFNPRRRALTLPGFHQAYLHRAARNLASALAALHDAKVVVGDLNERNVLVTPRALVTLIDADSFQIQRLRPAEIVFYPCPVGRAEYTPPELQGQPFRDAIRLPEHDAFGLAVLIFQLLMAGSHPFRGAWLEGPEAPPLEEKIRRGWFPYVDRPIAPVAPPPGGRTIDTLHPGLVDAFLHAFVHGHSDPRQRPAADEWARRLEAAEAHLTTCRSGHSYADHLRACPECGAPRRRAFWSGRRRPSAARVVAPRHVGTTPVASTRPAVPSVPVSMASVGVMHRAHRVARTVGLASAAAVGAGASGLVIAGVAVVRHAPDIVAASGGDAIGGLRLGIIGFLAGGVALAGVTWVRATASPPSGRAPRRIGREAMERLIGWGGGWAAAVAILATAGLVRGGSAPGVGATVDVVAGFAHALEVGWPVGWALYGAVAGTVTGDDANGRPAHVAALFAGVGCLTGWGLLRLVAHGM